MSKMSDEELTKNIYEAMQVAYLSERHDAIKHLINQQVLAALREVKSHNDWVSKTYDYGAELYGAVPLSAIEEIERKYK